MLELIREKTLFYQMHEESFWDKNNIKFRPYYAALYYFVQLFGGFLGLWLSQYLMDKRFSGTPYYEAMWLVLCVHWGSVGWGRYKQLKEIGSFELLSNFVIFRDNASINIIAFVLLAFNFDLFFVLCS